MAERVFNEAETSMRYLYWTYPCAEAFQMQVLVSWADTFTSLRYHLSWRQIQMASAITLGRVG